MIKLKRALISVSDKKDLIPFAKGLKKLNVEILSTGGTAKKLREAGIEVMDVSDYTGFPEMMQGRVKTLHPKIHGGLLALRENESHMAEAKKNKVGMIDMVVVNLYPFEDVIKKKNVSMKEAIENIDIGGPSMLRSAAKNYKSVAVICNPGRYKEILNELDLNNGLLSDSVLFKLGVEAFAHTAHYDGVISSFLSQNLTADDFTEFPDERTFSFRKVQDLRYGENPHQSAAFYQDSENADGLALMNQIHGKELSFNNILDLNAAVQVVRDFSKPTAVIIKHNNPTGIAEDESLAKAYKAAHQCDPLSAFGGIIGLNKKVDEQTAKAISESGFMECVIAPGFDVKARKILTKKKNVRLCELPLNKISSGGLDAKRVYGGLLLQQQDEKQISKKDLNVVSKKKPTPKEIDAMIFGWKIVKFIRSNAIVLIKGKKTIGIGCGQTSRVESVNIAIRKAGKLAKGSIMISDAFLPKTDNVELAAKAGIKAIIQTGGSIADGDVIKEANKHKMAMVLTGCRHFKH